MLLKQSELLNKGAPMTKLLSHLSMLRSLYSTSGPPRIAGLFSCHLGLATVALVLNSVPIHFITLLGSIAVTQPSTALLLRQVA